ncbi:MAG: ubiquitin carboxyl-hydrolase [Rikenellaceae bacterium]
MRKNKVNKRPQSDAKTGESVIAVVAVVRESNDSAQPQKATLPKSATERIEALRTAGVDVSSMFAMTGANGGEYVASNKDGKLTMLDDNDPIFKLISEQGTVPNRRLFRRWVMAQMFHMLSYTPYRSQEPVGVTAMIRRLGYDYQWKMMLGELYTQVKMEGRDIANLRDRNRWFNANVAIAMAEGYIAQLKEFVECRKEKKCKGVPYKRVGGQNIFVEDLDYKLYAPLYKALRNIKSAKSLTQLYNALQSFDDMRIRLSNDASQCNLWVDAYKGAGAYFTMQNLIRFHDCVAIDDIGKPLNKTLSLFYIEEKAKIYCEGNGWRLLAVLKKMLSDNNIDIKAKQSEWRKK